MEYSVNNPAHPDSLNTLSYDKAAVNFENEVKEAKEEQELSCSLQLKNLLLTNLKLLKLNEISSVILF